MHCLCQHLQRHAARGGHARPQVLHEGSAEGEDVYQPLPERLRPQNALRPLCNLHTSRVERQSKV
jgi:hypothetical protein